MSHRVRIAFLLMIFAIGPIALGLVWLSYAERGRPPVERPAGVKLAVVLVFDQMRGDYLSKWKHLFVEGGFRRLQDEGAWFTNCHYPYSDTLTAAGHASLLTGATPHDHGIIGNEWYDRKLKKVVAASDNDRGSGPLRRKSPTVGDVLLSKTGRRGKVASLSIKERSAIMMAALRAQIVYWLSKLGKFETSTYYPSGPHRWATQFNKSKKIESWLKQPWNRLRTDIDYTQNSGPDDLDFEGSGYDQGRTFPHPTPNIDAVTNSPFGSEALLTLAKTLIDAEKLGQRDVPDLLCISFSSNDLVGHCFGPDSQEVLDITLRSDLIVKELLDFLDDRVGKGNYAVALSGDHGACSIPAIARAMGKDAGYVPRSLLTGRAEAFLQSKFGKAGEKESWVEQQQNHWIYLNQAVLQHHGLEPATAEKALAEWLVQQPGVQSSFTRSQLASPSKLDDPLAEQVRQSFHPECSGDVMVVLKPNYLLMDEPVSRKTKAYATTHGSPHPYDTWVPLLIMAPGINQGVYEERVAPQSLAALVSRSLGIELPEGARYFPPDRVYRTEERQ